MFLYLKNIFKREAVQKAPLCRSEKRLLLIEVSILQNIGWGHLDKGKCGYYYLSFQVKRGTLSPPNRRWRWVAIKESCRVQTLWTISPRSRLSHSRLRPLSTVHHHQMQKIRGERKKEKSYNFLFYFSSILR